MSLQTLADWLQADSTARFNGIQSCLRRIHRLDPAIHAWVNVITVPVMGREGPLSTIPFGVKDTIDTRDLATEFGSPVYKGRLTETDAALVCELTRRGAVLLGKTHTAAFGYRTPSPTRNPLNLQHTPGASSSGS